MITNTQASHFIKTTSINSEGKVIPAYAYNRDVPCNIQPLQLTDVQRNGWGISDYSANSKLMFIYNIDNPGIVEDSLIRWNGKEYTVKGINIWDSPGPAIHTELLLKPVQGVVYTT